MSKQLKSILWPIQNKSRQLRHKSQSSKWKFEFIGSNISGKKNAVQTKIGRHDEHWSSGPRPVKICLDSIFFPRYIRTNKLKFSFRGLRLVSQLSRFILNWSQYWLKLFWHCPDFPRQILNCLNVSFCLDTFYSVSILLD
jgi:hypothetical protein